MILYRSQYLWCRHQPGDPAPTVIPQHEHPHAGTRLENMKVLQASPHPAVSPHERITSAHASAESIPF